MESGKSGVKSPPVDEEMESSIRNDAFVSHGPRRSFVARQFLSILCHSVIALSYFLAITVFVKRTMPRLPNLIPIPGRDVIEYKVQQMYTSEADPSPYMGNTDDSDRAWHDLMQHTSIRLTDEELRRLNRTSVALGDGGYLGMTTVFHEFHCLASLTSSQDTSSCVSADKFQKMVRWSTNLTRYGHWFGVRDHLELSTHINHCMDVVRQSIMCRADLSPMTFFWTPNSRVPETDFNTPHECVNWDKVEAWLEERRIDIYAPGVLNHPVFGALRG
ncbi:hypothetical protein TOPH_04037 [Tolypocladium ophioglossoides CBS 100239]|uniref:Tat pathway signal sequence n=1 Tax=Tolypocladium ophioglossoides (strain CBS 100239) TaxID=1163406 RepID=A0A0L0NB26_TOLOC|nr:hypothetical protein TOPH_04037 [Tolypocladium ophioglossoides CBS 100239]